ncbi:MAG: DUF3667 domain-containing protein [Undibacterium sp.]|nr:DUF3667 domain-containing protein [Undibacterium sp.]
MGVEIASEVITAAAAVKEIESGDGQIHLDEKGRGDCANCGTPLSGHYCHACGQSSHIHRSLLHMFEELLHGLFHFDTKAWRTIPALMFRPGELTRQYIEGKRTSFVSPLALFLFLIFLMFFVFSLVTDEIKPEDLNKTDDPAEVATLLVRSKVNLKIQENILKTDFKNKRSLEKQFKVVLEAREALFKAQGRQEKSSGQIKSADAVNKELAQAQGVIVNSKVHNDAATLSEEAKFEQEKASRYAEQDLKLLGDKYKQAMKQEMQREAEKSGKKTSTAFGVSGDITMGDHKIDVDTKSSDTDRTFETSLMNSWLGKLLEHADKNRELTLYKMKKNASSLAFLLMPISLPFLWLLFAFRRQYKMFDHAVFSLYSLSFMCALIILLTLINAINFTGIAVVLFLIIPPIHMYRQLRAAYQLSVLASVWRTIALLFIALASLLVYALMVAGLSL